MASTDYTGARERKRKFHLARTPGMTFRFAVFHTFMQCSANGHKTVDGIDFEEQKGLGPFSALRRFLNARERNLFPHPFTFIGCGLKDTDSLSYEQLIHCQK
jgi:hypothetical protein